MTLINQALIYGFVLVAVPLLLHLLMRAKPKKLLFPALRLIQKRRLQNSRRMRLRHLWLLLLRMAVIAALVGAIARPSLPAANYSLNLREYVTLGVIGLLAVGIYFGLSQLWQRTKLPQHTLAARRTYLRGGLGVASFLFVLLGVGWPYQQRIAAEITSPVPTASIELPAAAVFLFDTSLSMAYTQEGETRLDVARRIANTHLSSLPARSQIAVGDCSTSDPIIFLADASTAKARIEQLKPTARSYPLNERLRNALVTQEDDRQRTFEGQGTVAEAARTDRFVREVYLFTDLARSGWSKSVGTLLHDELKRLEWLGIYVVDVGEQRSLNAGLTKLRLSRESVATGGEAVLTVSVPSIGQDGVKQVVELHLENDAGEMQKKDQRTVELDDASIPEVQFVARGLTRKTHRGKLKLVTPDPLVEDNQLDFAIRVDASLKAAVISPTEGEATYLQTALEVQGYDVSYVPERQLEKTELRSFDVVCLVNAIAPTNAVWRKLASYAENGGGVAVFTGSAQFEQTKGILSTAYLTDDAKAVLPAELLAPLKFTPPKSLDLKDTTHPILKKFEGAGIAADLMSVDVRRYWKVEPFAASKVITTFTDRDATPALIERPLGAGRVVMLTTAVDLTRDWSELARTPPWHFLALSDQLLQYLSNRSAARANFIAGEEAVIPLNREKPLKRYLLRKPSGLQLPGDVPVGQNEVRISETDERGAFEIVSATPDISFAAGFAVNPPAEESDFTRMTPEDLDQVLGEKRYSLASSIEGLERNVTTGRLGVEAYSWLLALLIAAFCLEHLVANRFYGNESEALPAPAR